jgi:cell division protein FtsW
VIWVILGLVLATILTFMDYHFIRNIAQLIILGTIFLLTLVLFIPSSIQGATRTVLNGSVQPSALAKIALVIYLAYWLSNKQDKVGTRGGDLGRAASELGLAVRGILQTGVRLFIIFFQRCGVGLLARVKLWGMCVGRRKEGFSVDEGVGVLD